MTFKKLQSNLEDLRSRMETLLEDETVLDLPRRYNKIKDDFDEILTDMEDGNYNSKERDEE